MPELGLVWVRHNVFGTRMAVAGCTRGCKLIMRGFCSQGTILELTTSRQDLEARLKDVSKRFEAAQAAAAAAAQEAEQRLEHAQVGVPNIAQP